MTWFKLDDGFYDHPKVADLPNAAVGLWVKAAVWCSKHLTDGVVPASRVRLMKGTKAQIDALIECGLWSEVSADRSRFGSKSYVFHDWNQYQPSRKEKEEQRAKDAERKRESRERKAAEQQERENVTPESHVTVPWESHRSHNDVRRCPDPTRPDPTRPSEGEVSPSNPLLRSAAPNGESVALSVVGDGGAGVGSSADDDRGVSATGSGASKKASKKRRNYAREYSPEFERFWSAYPKKAGKGDAFDRFLEVVADGISVETLVRGAENYAEYVRNSGTDSKHVKNPQGWLSDGRWEDSAEYVPESATAPSRASWDDVLDGMSGGYPGGISGEYSEGGFLDAEVVDAEPVAPWESRAIGGGF